MRLLSTHRFSLHVQESAVLLLAFVVVYFFLCYLLLFSCLSRVQYHRSYCILVLSFQGSSSTVISVSEDSTGQEACDNEESTGQPVSDPLSITPTHSPPRSLPHDDPSIRYHYLAAPSTSRPVSSVSPARKRRRKETPQVDDSSESDDTGISLCPSNKIIKATTALVSGFMALLSEKQQLEVAVKIRKLLQEHRISEENPDE